MPPKKDKPKPEGWNFDPIEGIIVLLFLMAILASLVTSVWSYLSSGELSFYGYRLSGLLEFFKSNAWFFKTLGFVTAGGAAIGSFIYTKGGDAVWREEKTKLYPSKEEMKATSSDTKTAPNKQTGRWEKIVKLSESENSSDWRLAIIEADIMLDELLQNLQLPGDTMGEKLKAVEKSDFTTLEYAWEAHKARNNITHEGNNFLLNQRETARIISLYEAVFKEFFII
jgi:hypothetical protein